MKLWTGLLGTAALCVLSGCASRYLPVDEAGRTTAVPPPANVSAPTATPSVHDTCGADQLQYLVGKSRLQIPVAVDMSKRRVACTTCVLSQVDDPSRTTILFDETSGLVTSVKCQ
jgi:hypothetical protein